VELIAGLHHRIKAVAHRLLGEQTMGMIDFHRHPGKRAGWGGAFNGQIYRQRLVEALVVSIAPEAFVETGTHIGTTTEFLAGFDKPVFTVEGEPHAYGFSKARLRKLHNVTLTYDDSRKALRRWFEGPLRKLADATLFVYLDAHWNFDLPLAAELDIIFQYCKAPVVMIDDFEVPGQPGYGYDDFGNGQTLNFDYIAPAVSAHRLSVFFPTTPADDETGRRRGCVVLARDFVHGRQLSSVVLLRPAANIPVRVIDREGSARE
jgi:hypothetical protein